MQTRQRVECNLSFFFFALLCISLFECGHFHIQWLYNYCHLLPSELYTEVRTQKAKRRLYSYLSQKNQLSYSRDLRFHKSRQACAAHVRRVTLLAGNAWNRVKTRYKDGQKVCPLTRRIWLTPVGTQLVAAFLFRHDACLLLTCSTTLHFFSLTCIPVFFVSTCFLLLSSDTGCKSCHVVVLAVHEQVALTATQLHSFLLKLFSLL